MQAELQFQDEPMDTLSIAKRKFLSTVRDGAVCECCNRPGKIYRRKLNSGIARALIYIYKHAVTDMDVFRWIDVRALGDKMVSDSIKKNVEYSYLIELEYSKLRYWGLIERKPYASSEEGLEIDEEANSYWRITQLGVMFVRGFEKVKSHALIFDGNLMALDGEMIDLQWCLGNHFNLGELMAA